MGAPFDDMAMRTFAITAKVMGYDGTWSPVAGGGTRAARVHLKTPTSQEELGDFQYDQRKFICEWKKGDWTGLDTAYANGSEQVTINGIAYAVISVKLLFDGQTFQGILQSI